jgi:alpha-1,3-rhamnosyltransferase
VSILVITYNSSKYVLETLESAKKQTYRNIELIVSDDGSKDSTVSICKEWINKNTKYFKRCCIDHGEINRGIPANCNKGIRQCYGEWVKLIAGDDKLLPNCIMDDVSYVADHPETDILFSKMICFGEKGIKCNVVDPGPYFRYLSKEEFEMVLRCINFIPAPTEFIKRSCFMDIGGWDESIPLIEDWPFWIKALEHRKTISFLYKETVYYRFSDSSLSQQNSKFKPSNEYIDSLRKVLDQIHIPLFKIYKGSKYYIWSHQTKLEGTILGKILHVTNIFDPFYYKYKKVLKKLSNIHE